MAARDCGFWGAMSFIGGERLIGFGASVPLVVEGVRRGNRSMALSGGGVIIGSAGLWLLGRYVFGWW